MSDRRTMLKGFMASTVGLANFRAIPSDSRPIVAPRHRGGGIYATKGKKTYCANGCQIGHFGNTVKVGALPKTGDLVPVEGMSIGMEACPFCQAAVTSDGGYFFST